VSPARLAAFEILRRVEAGAYASVLLAAHERQLNSSDRALCHELVMGVLRWQLWLDSLTEYYANRKVENLDAAVRISLRLGLYQLRLLSRIPASAAVNESVSLVHLARLRSAEGFVNAILRRATREPDYDPAAGIADPIERVAIETSHPPWLIKRWTKAFDFSETEAFARANSEPAPTALRVVTTKATNREVIDLLRSSGAIVFASKVTNGAWRVSGTGNLLRHLTRAGQVYIQDEASQLVAEVLEAKSGDRVLDLCAAPGSKTTQIADRAADSANVVASDLHQHRLHTVIETAKLHSLRSISCLALDGLLPLPFKENSFDRVLVDAPCSGTGTLRRNPEIRWRISAEDIRELATRQKHLLFNASRVVRPGGRLVYSTCSVEPEENEEVVKAFLQGNHEFKQLQLPVNPSLITASGAARTWPHRGGTDGFFIVALERKHR
jgi:16S rRNA (cytosine967-C5)-methyltransferase